jgi:hypothetical protein
MDSFRCCMTLYIVSPSISTFQSISLLWLCQLWWHTTLFLSSSSWVKVLFKKIVLSLFLKRNYSDQLEEEKHEIFLRRRRAIWNSLALKYDIKSRSFFMHNVNYTEEELGNHQNFTCAIWDPRRKLDDLFDIWQFCLFFAHLCKSIVVNREKGPVNMVNMDYAINISFYIHRMKGMQNKVADFDWRAKNVWYLYQPWVEQRQFVEMKSISNASTKVYTTCCCD